MNCKLITKENLTCYEQMLELRHLELRVPLGLNLYNEDLSDEINQYVFVLENEAEIQSCLLIKRINKSELKLRQMATKKQAQGKGFGSHLVQFAEEWGRDKQFEKITLHAREYAMPFYKKLGYNIVGEKFEEVGIPHFKMIKKITE